MKTRTTLTGLFAMLLQPFTSAFADERHAWTRTRSAAPSSPVALEPLPVVMSEPTVTISVAVAAEPIPPIAVEPVALATPAPAVTEPPAPVPTPEPEFTVAADVKCEPKAAKRTRKPALAMAGANRTTTKKPRKPTPRPKRSPASPSA